MTHVKQMSDPIARCPHCGTDFTPSHLRAEIERLTAQAEKDAAYVGNLEYTLNEIICVSEDEWAVEVSRRALEGK